MKNGTLCKKVYTMAIYNNVMKWQLFASSEEVQKGNNNIVCPHCGNPIKVTIIKE